jgi:hypothetical protein
MDLSLTWFISVSPIHGAQDASHSPSTHSLSPRGTVRHSASTWFVHTCPFAELVLVTYVTTWKFVNADTSHILRRTLQPSRVRHLRFQQRDVISDLPEAWTAVGCYTLVITQPLQERSIF